ncbi:MAG TPA: 3-hydroxyacyl-CoA dehydrogenase NAD-binding domain-containing protein [Verrucomicrobiales bacterium]|nr:3-hydroxyacyl-CoA dehydrogenase NAD-binding domain-containing protein [Verrucomicrobiales bacterium]
MLGAGQMGAAAAVMFQRAGFDVSLWTRRTEALEAAKPAMAAVDAFLTEHFPAPGAKGSLQLEPDLTAVDAASDAVLECVVEDMAQKTALLRRLESCRQRGALVMSCTSALSITDMAAGSGMESVLVGAHFWNPPHLIPVVEIVAGTNTPPAQSDRAFALMQQIGKTPVRCADVPGFIGNRLMHAMWREALALVDAGVCTPEDIDRVVKGTFALRLPVLGPMENMDLVGLGLVESVERYLFPHLATNAAPSESLTKRLRAGSSGMKAGRGFYDWSLRDPSALSALRDRQIVRQLQFLQDSSVSQADRAGPKIEA